MGDTDTIKIGGAQTRGVVALLHLRGDETVVILEGALEVTAGGRMVRAPAGTVIHVPRGTAHCDATAGAVPVRMLFLHTPVGMQRMFSAIGTPAQAGLPAPPRRIMSRSWS